MKWTLTIAFALALAATPALARGGGGHAGHWQGYNSALGYARGGAIFNGRIGRGWGYQPNYGVAGYGGAAIAGALLGFIAPRIIQQVPVPVPVAPPVEVAQAPPTDSIENLSDAEILAAFGRNAEEQRRVLWNGAQAFCRTYPADRMCTAPQQGTAQ
jgi:hypothetical protein